MDDNASAKISKEKLFMPTSKYNKISKTGNNKMLEKIFSLKKSQQLHK